MKECPICSKGIMVYSCKNSETCVYVCNICGKQVPVSKEYDKMIQETEDNLRR